MNKTLSAFLAKYHKQELIQNPTSKKQNKEMLTVVNQYFPMVTIKDENDVLYLPIYYQSMLNKKTLQQAYEAIRNKNFDIWQTIPFTQQNQLLQMDIAPIKDQLPKFEYENTTITVAFLEPLFNSLLDKQTPIFELPQFFKLYKDFKDQVIHPKFYGSAPFKANLALVQFIFEVDQWCCLYHPSARILYVLEDFKIRLRMPLDQSKEYTQEALKLLSIAILEDNVEQVKQQLLTMDALNKRATNKAKSKAFSKINSL